MGESSRSNGGESVRTPSSRRRPGRREELSAAALEVIRVVGPGASMHEMAAKAGITKPVLYRYFGDRDGLIASVAQQYAEVLTNRIAQAQSSLSSDDSEELIRVGVSTYISFIEEDPALYSFLTHQAPLGSRSMVAVFDQIAESVELIVTKQLECRQMDTAPASTWAHGIVGMVHLAGARWARQPDISKEEVIAELTALISAGLTGAARPVAEGAFA
jgi:AcrR family transcriptional regulator